MVGLMEGVGVSVCFFVKQKTAYEMRISDWSADVCSSDLALRQEGRAFRLPAGSRILDTGGYKGQSRELPLDAFYSGISELLGVPRELCINMYGMTEQIGRASCRERVCQYV